MINAVQLAHPEQINQVAAGIARSFQTVLTYESTWAILHLLFDQWRDIGNLLWERIPQEYLQERSTEEVLAAVVCLVEQLSGYH